MKQRVPEPEAQSRIDALTAEIDVAMRRKARRIQTVHELQAEIFDLSREVERLKGERGEILRTCERVEVDR